MYQTYYSTLNKLDNIMYVIKRGIIIEMYMTGVATNKNHENAMSI